MYDQLVKNLKFPTPKFYSEPYEKDHESFPPQKETSFYQIIKEHLDIYNESP